MHRIDKVVVFKTLRPERLEPILENKSPSLLQWYEREKPD
jgi:hypothetical protein